MVLLRSLSGKTAGEETLARRFPFRVGRGTDNHLRLEEAGLWEDHFQLEKGPNHSVLLRAHPSATTLVNGQPVEAAELRLGDRIGAGAAEFHFWLSPPCQVGLTLRETVTWFGLALLVGLEIFLASSLMP